MAHDTVPLVDLERLSHAHEVRRPIVAIDVFQAAFFKRDTRGTGNIYVEDVREMLLALGFEPEDDHGCWMHLVSARARAGTSRMLRPSCCSKTCG